jgi:hypothetical protein
MTKRQNSLLNKKMDIYNTDFHLIGNNFIDVRVSRRVQANR